MTTDIPIERTAAVLAALQRHPDAVLSGFTAAALLGAAAPAHVSDPVEITREGGARPSPGLCVRREHLEPTEVTEVALGSGVRVGVTSPARTAFDVARRASTVDAVLTVEALIRRHHLTLDDVRDTVAQHPYARGLVRLRTALSLVEPGARAGIESPVRIALQVAGLPAPVVGHCVVDDGALWGVVDLSWPEARCGLVCDREPEIADLMTALPVLAGWRVHVVTRRQWDTDPDGVVERTGHLVRAGRRRHGLDRAADRRPILRGTRPPRRRPRPLSVFPELRGGSRS